ncbi:hypothetical protein C0Q70_10155 [Pomacea canaliculata]|uniref:GOLD domain-containing protein n=1 Tax=Pomacea canaliculata TaxID=400727 RepID=A0A2T7PBU1_POMCA|nr:hypothetical protein C0Q70_10155 [Pomacea canaliculata]
MLRRSTASDQVGDSGTKTAMMWTFFSVSVMLAVSWTVSAQGLDDPCTVMPHGPEITENGGVVTVPSECLKGRVWWNYPRGTLEVQFHQPKLFTVCLEPSLGPFLSSVSQVDGNGKEISINLRPDGDKKETGKKEQKERKDVSMKMVTTWTTCNDEEKTEKSS